MTGAQLFNVLGELFAGVTIAFAIVAIFLPEMLRWLL
jgi:hypothetical protein